MAVNYDDVVAFIRASNLLEKWTDNEIKNVVASSALTNALSYTVDNQGKLNGIVFGKWDSPELLHVYCAIGELKGFLNYLRHNFPSCRYISAFRKNGRKFLTYNLSKFNILCQTQQHHP